MLTSQPSPSTNSTTRIESLVEGIEEFVRAVIHQANLPTSPRRYQVDAANQMVNDGRESMKIALREFVQPMLRTINGGPQPYAEGTLTEDMPNCAFCLRKVPCAHGCEHWASAIRRMRNEAMTKEPA